MPTTSYGWRQLWFIAFAATSTSTALGGWVWKENKTTPWWPDPDLSQNGHQGVIYPTILLTTSLSCSLIHASLDFYDTSVSSTTHPTDIFLKALVGGICLANHILWLEATLVHSICCHFHLPAIAQLCISNRSPPWTLSRIRNG